MNSHTNIVIIGGGLSGLCCAIHLAKANIPVTLIEKETYPKHKVCGEYISNEVLPYFEFLDIGIAALNPVPISKFSISTQHGNIVHSDLPMGGFGISRYTLDYHLWKKAKELGVQLITDQVIDVQYTKQDVFEIKTSSDQIFTSNYVIGAYGKRSILDQKLQRPFAKQKSSWLAVKAHYRAVDFNRNTVALHNFEGGYCGLSMVENNRVNACYLVSYESFKKYKNIDLFQKAVLYQNEHLKAFFKQATPIFDTPISISQVNFSKKQSVQNHIFMLGDTAGLIHPLCGNGMAMAIKSAQILGELLVAQYQSSSQMSRNQIEKAYAKHWKKAFSKRLWTGRVLQRILLNSTLQDVSYSVATILPFIVPKIIKQTHGEPIVC